MTSKPFHRPWIASAVIAAASLAACGGGDDDAPPVSGGPAPTVPTTVTGQYRLEAGATTAAAALTTLNALGQQGYGFVSPVSPYAVSIPVVVGDLYVTDSAHTGSKLQYTLATPATTTAALLQQLNQNGANGALYKGDQGYGTAPSFDFRSMFVKDTTKTTTFTYELKATTLPANKAALLAELNAQGARGFRFQSAGTIGAGNEAFHLYVKASAPAATYAYTFVDSPATGAATGAALKQLLNTQGADGRALLGATAVNDFSTFVQIFEKSSLQTSALSYDVVAVDTNDTLAQSTAKANVRAAAGEFLYGDLMTADQKFNTVYVKGAVSNRHPLSGPVFP